jgi:hypothetical protein
MLLILSPNISTDSVKVEQSKNIGRIKRNSYSPNEHILIYSIKILNLLGNVLFRFCLKQIINKIDSGIYCK